MPEIVKNWEQKAKDIESERWLRKGETVTVVHGSVEEISQTKIGLDGRPYTQVSYVINVKETDGTIKTRKVSKTVFAWVTDAWVKSGKKSEFSYTRPADSNAK